MIRFIKKWLFILIILALLVWIGKTVLKKTGTSSVRTLAAKVETIKQSVKLSTLDITSEEIYKDTIGSKGVVMRIKANVRIGFDLENIPTSVRGDTLYVQLPREIIDIYESSSDGYQVLDVWYLPLPNEPAPITLTTAEENLVKQQIKRQITNQMYEKGYVRRARENAARSLSVLFSKFKDHIIIIDNYPEGTKGSPPAPPKGE